MSNLHWLLPFDAEAKSALRNVLASDPMKAANLWRIAHYDLPLTASQKLARRVRDNSGSLPDAFRLVRMGLLGTDTLDYLAEAMTGAGLKHGLVLLGKSETIATALPMIHAGGDPFSGERMEFVVILPSLSRISETLSPVTSAEEVCEHLLADVSRMASWAVEEKKAVPILGLPPMGFTEIFNASDLLIPWTETSVRQNLTVRICELAKKNGWPIWNVDHLASTVGSDRWLNDKQYYWAKMPFDLELVMRVADSLGRIVAAATGKTRRVLVLDLDNTVWGGVIGDDGIEGILIGEGDGVGEGHLALQKIALALKKRGVVLAICSKNDDAVARRPFREHPDMALKEEDIAVFQANWNDKATNLKAIADAMNLTTASLAFLDDNPAERMRVRQMLPEVAVIEPGDDVSEYARRTIMSGYFEHLTLTKEDIARAKVDENSGRRAELLCNIGNYEEYLASLDMVLSMRRFDSATRQRIAQLINKSNQFNLTTRRYTVQEVEEIEKGNNRIGLQFRLADKFGENGMISVVVLEPSGGDVWEIDTWLMSCRVLKRGVEQAVLNEIALLAAQSGITRLRGRYIPTSKNAMVADHYRDLGFSDVTPQASGNESTVWELDLGTYTPRRVFMAVDREPA